MKKDSAYTHVAETHNKATRVPAGKIIPNPVGKAAAGMETRAVAKSMVPPAPKGYKCGGKVK